MVYAGQGVLYRLAVSMTVSFKAKYFFFHCSNKNDLRICSLLGNQYQDTKRIDFQLQFLTTR